MMPDPKDARPWDSTACDWDEVSAYRRIPGVEKIDQSLRLQQMGRERALLGIRNQRPHLTEEQVQQEFARRTDLFRRISGRDK